jgi:hypothetical protein
MIKIAFLWKPENYFLSGNNANNVFYHFFMKELNQHPLLNVDYIKVKTGADCRAYKNYDALLFVNPFEKFTPRLENMQDLNIPKFAMSGDCHAFELAKPTILSYGEDINYFFITSEKYFYKFFPKEYKYKQIIFGLDPEEGIYKDIPSFSGRIENEILNTGLLNPTYHALRIACNGLDYVKYIPKKEYVGDDFSSLLTRYKAAIAANTLYCTFKPLEVALAGCVPFLEITELNEGFDLGFRDGIDAVFINEDNYKDKFTEYLKTKDDIKWENMANKARKFVLDNYTIKHGVDKLVDYIKENL